MMPDSPVLESYVAADVVRGVSRLLFGMGYAVLAECSLGNSRRADVLGLNERGEFALVEVKVSMADLKGDLKWPEYLSYCDRFWFAVPPTLDRAVFDTAFFQPDRVGVIVADRFEAAIVRPATLALMAGARRKAETLRFGRRAADRLLLAQDPALQSRGAG